MQEDPADVTVGSLVPDTFTTSNFHVIPTRVTTTNTGRRRLDFTQENGDPGVNVGAVLRLEPIRVKNGDVPAMEKVAAKVNIRVNLQNYDVFKKQRNASRSKGSILTSKSTSELLLEAAKVVDMFIQDVETKRAELNPLRFGPGGLTTENLFILALEPVGKCMFDCVLAYRQLPSTSAPLDEAVPQLPVRQTQEGPIDEPTSRRDEAADSGQNSTATDNPQEHSLGPQDELCAQEHTSSSHINDHPPFPFFDLDTTASPPPFQSNGADVTLSLSYYSSLEAFSTQPQAHHSISPVSSSLQPASLSLEAMAEHAKHCFCPGCPFRG